MSKQGFLPLLFSVGSCKAPHHLPTLKFGLGCFLSGVEFLTVLWVLHPLWRTPGVNTELPAIWLFGFVLSTFRGKTKQPAAWLTFQDSYATSKLDGKQQWPLVKLF